MNYEQIIKKTENEYIPRIINAKNDDDAYSIMRDYLLDILDMMNPKIQESTNPENS